MLAGICLVHNVNNWYQTEKWISFTDINVTLHSMICLHNMKPKKRSCFCMMTVVCVVTLDKGALR